MSPSCGLFSFRGGGGQKTLNYRALFMVVGFPLFAGDAVKTFRMLFLP